MCVFHLSSAQFDTFVAEFPTKKSSLNFLQFGLAQKSGVIPFYKSKNDLIESLSSTAGDEYNPEPHLWAPVMDFDSFRRVNQHDWVDVLKADIESAEFDMLLNMDLKHLRVTQVLIEFHSRWYKDGWNAQKNIYKRMEDAGYKVVHEGPRNEEVVFLRTVPLPPQ